MSRASKDELRTRLLAIFREEAADHLRGIAREMEALGSGLAGEAASAALGQLFRIVHTLKGAARSLSVREVEQVCHQIEDLCGELVQGRAPFDAQAHDLLRELTDSLAAITAEVLSASSAQLPAPEPPAQEPPPAAPETAPAPAAAPPPPPRAPARPQGPPAIAEAAPRAAERPPAVPAAPPSFVRIEAGQVQRLGLLAEDLLGPRLASQARAQEARRILADLAALRRDPSEGRGASTAPSAAEGLRAVEQAMRRLSQALSEDTRTLRGVTDSLIVELRRARMMPAGEMLAVFPSMVSDLARETGKDVMWRAAGSELLIDRQLVELIKDPLIHAVRNAIDHGIEAPQARAEAGKPRQGTISLSVEPADGGRVAIEIADDGAGIDLKSVREAAVRARMLSSEEAARLSEADTLNLIFQSSLSTRSIISTVSGRGLGLAIVREWVERLGGNIRLHSTPGAGTVLRLEVPAALANFRGIAVTAGGMSLIWPRDVIERTLAISAADHEAAHARGTIQLDGELLHFGHLGQVLGLDGGTPPESGLRSAVIVRQGPRRAVIVVDEISGDCEVVVKELRPPLLCVRHVLAAGLLGTGKLALILRAADVIEALSAKPRTGLAQPRPARRAGRHRLLIVDDSLTTRAMEMGLLEAAGYEVHAAADGLEAWEALRTHEFDAVVSDVDMPNMDGFELTEKIRSDPRLRELPIVLVTALEKREDHNRGIRLGANAYMMKSAFDQSMLLDLVRRVL